MTTQQPDTKAYWKRRALRAELQLEQIERIRSLEFQAQKKSIFDSACRLFALNEIRALLKELDQLEAKN